MAPSSSFGNFSEIKHEVFISFRGTDVRRGLLSHLRKELHRKRIDFFVDERLQRGDEISSTLLRAIEGSQILLVIFSKDYASSKWCLEELAKMIECTKRNNKQILLPVFFNVDPSEVRNQQGGYGYALAQHEKNLKEFSFKVQNWRAALEKASQFAGYHYPTNFEDESDLIDKVVKDISEKLSNFCLSESSGLIGIVQGVEQIESLLRMESKEIILLGIWGMGGIGKTTIARVIFDKYFHQYDGCCFLKVKEELKQHELTSLRERLIYELFEGENLHTTGTSKARFSNFAGRRMSQRRVFVVLDDVNTSEQLTDLVGKPNCFGPGSRVIITSRDKHVLTSAGVHQIHEVEKMNDQDSLKLFCFNAFNESQPKRGYEKLSNEVVKIAQGNPLALKVLGTDFHSKSIVTWKCALRKIKKYPNEKIQQVLRVSYDGLKEVEQKAFLDIAFFFKDDDKDYVTRQLDAWGFHGASGIEVLEQKALITISNDNRIEMHDLIQEMGYEIVRQECIKYPGRRSRLREKEEVYDVLRNNRGTNEVEAMEIEVPQIRYLPMEVNTFKKMPRLRFIKFHCPLLAELSMPPGHVKKLLQGVQDFVNSKRTDLNRSNMLVEFSQILSGAFPLEKEYLLQCESFCDASLWNQVELLFSGSRCKELVSVENEIHIKCNHYLLVEGFPGPKEFSVSSEEIRQLNIVQPTIEILNLSIGQVSNLELSDVDDQHFKNLPNEFFCLRSMYYLKLSRSKEQDTRKQKPNLHILFDGLRYYQRISFNEMHNSPEFAGPQNIYGYSRFPEWILDDNLIIMSSGLFIHQLLLTFIYLGALAILYSFWMTLYLLGTNKYWYDIPINTWLYILVMLRLLRKKRSYQLRNLLTYYLKKDRS